jgi:diguanylate cyclase (GGDEF)-like protein/PAS domain S-box-containing protein
MDGFSHELLLDHLQDGVCFIDQHGDVVYWNHGAERITGFPKEGILHRPAAGGPLRHLNAEGEALFDDDPFNQCLKADASFEADAYVRQQGGELVPVLARISPIRDSRGETIGVLEVFSDNRTKVQDRNRIVELEEIALLCPLTEVGNRRYAEMALASAMEELTRYGWRFALLFVDLDHFKQVNDVYGHKVGDDILRMSAQALRSALRSFDFVGRWGGEEFVVILPNMTEELLLLVGERCRRVIEESVYQTEGRRVQVTASIGCTMARDDDTLDSAIERGDRLMYESKQAGRNRCTFEE